MNDDDTRPIPADEAPEPAPAEVVADEATAEAPTAPLPPVTPADVSTTVTLPPVLPAPGPTAAPAAPAEPTGHIRVVSAGIPMPAAPPVPAASTPSPAPGIPVAPLPGAVAAPAPAPAPVAQRVGTVVWGLVVAAIGIGLLSVAWGANLDTELALIVLLGVAGVALLVGSLVGLRRSRTRREGLS